MIDQKYLNRSPGGFQLHAELFFESLHQRRPRDVEPGTVVVRRFVIRSPLQSEIEPPGKSRLVHYRATEILLPGKDAHVADGRTEQPQ